MNKIRFLTILLFVLLGLSACASEPSFSTQSDGGVTPGRKTVPQTDSPEESKRSADDSPGRTEPSGNQPSTPSDQISIDNGNVATGEPAKAITRKIIRNADLQLEAASPEEVHQKITAITESKKGFVVQSQKSNSETSIRGGEAVTMSIRIPAESFNETITEIRKTAGRVINESVTGKDVTEEFIDIEARLKAKNALEVKFLEIMQNAKSVQDALNVQRELANVRGEIEQIEGRKKFLEDQASLSTININIRTPTAISGSSSGFSYELKEAVSDGFDAALAFILILIRVLIAVIPFLVLVVLPLLLILRYIWRQYKKKRLAKKFADDLNAETNPDVIEHTEDEN